MYPHHYWSALVALAKNNRNAALEILKQEDHEKGTRDKSTDCQTIDDVFDQIFLLFVAHDPQILSSLGLFESIGIRAHNAFLTDFSIQALQHDIQRKKQCLALLEQYALQDLTPEQRLSYKIFHWMLTHEVAGENYFFHEYRVNQLFGMLFELIAVLTQYHPLRDEQDVELYIKRLDASATQCQQIIALQEHQKRLGIFPPAFVCDRLLAMLEGLMPASVTDTIFYKHLADSLETITAVDKDHLREKVRESIIKNLYPALKALHAYFSTLQHTISTDHGVWALPDGDAYYAYTLARHTTLALSPDEIHALGLQEVARIQNRMRELLAQEGLLDTSKSVGILMQEWARNSRFYYQDSDDGRQECLADYHKILERCRTHLHPLFDKKPAGAVVVQQVPPDLHDGMPAAYYVTPSLDGSRPGTFFVNLRSMQEKPRYGMETLAVHEAEPGHHFQLALQREMSLTPARKLCEYTAYVEGWALYTEKLADDYGFYSTAAQRLGHLKDELLRAVRLVVDTGIHKKRWTKEQAIDYMVDMLGDVRDSVVTEVERYFVLPGQACAYTLGQRTILALRDYAQKTLGQKFDIREFHNVVLGTGAVPLPILEDVVHQYVQQKLHN